ncbi:MAG: FAD-dependent oxidoreductase [Dongiaceae bacterium]
MAGDDDKPLVVIGAGVVGVATALYLQRHGLKVTIVDPGGPGEGTSRGNASIIAVESCVPVATPGIARAVPGMLLDPLGPLAIRWSYLPRLAPWLWQFVRASAPARVEEISIALRAILVEAIPCWEPLLADAGIADMLRRNGMLLVFESEAKFAAMQPYLELQRRRGTLFDVVAPEELRQLEPTLQPIFRHAVLYREVGHTLDNFRLVQRLAEFFRQRGGTILRAAARGFSAGAEGVTQVLTEAGAVDCRGVVVAAGAWSRRLARDLGAAVPLDTERGYHVMLPEPGIMPRRPIYSAEGSFVATPLEHGLRLAGTVELGGLEAPPNYARADILLRHGRRIFGPLGESGRSNWMGFRPSLPDSLPVIGPAGRHRNAWLAFGHGHLGLTLAAVTGRLVADLVAGRAPVADPAPYRADRF